jgi:DNA-binding MarR family transcriptional regulator
MTTSSIASVLAVDPGTDRQAANIGQGLLRLASAVDAAYSRASRDLDLTSQQAQLLCAVGLGTGDDGRPVVTNRPTPVRQIAAELHCDQSNASHLVERAAKRGLLTRRRGAGSDGRVTLVELTEEGRQQLDRFIASLLQQTIDPLFSDWPPERQLAALEVLNSLADSVENAG